MYIPDGDINELSAIMYGDDLDSTKYVRVFKVHYRGSDVLIAAFYDGVYIKMAPVFPKRYGPVPPHVNARMIMPATVSTIMGMYSQLQMGP